MSQAHQGSLSPAQQGLWLISQLHPEGAFYHNVVVVRFEGPLRPDILERCITEIVRRHEPLRATFPVVDGAPIQVIAPSWHPTLPVVDVGALPAAERLPAGLARAAEEARRPFDLAAAPAVRTLLVRLAADDHLLVLTMHHIVSDGDSVTILLREVTTLYAALSQGQPSPLAELPVRYTEYIAERSERLHGERYAASVEFWRRELQGAPTVLTLPSDHARPPIPSYQGALYRLQLPPNLVSALRSLSRGEGVTVYMAMLATLGVLLYRSSGQHDILVGTPMTHRVRSASRAIVGYLVNTLVMRTVFEDDPTFRVLLGRVRRTALAAYAHSEVPFEEVVRILNPPRTASHHPLFQVMLSFNERGGDTLQASRFAIPGSGLRLSFPEIDLGTARFDLNLCVHEGTDSLGVDFEFSTDLFEMSTIERMASHFQTLLYGVAANPGSRISELPMLAAREWHQVVKEWNVTARPYPADRCIHELFEAQVERTPNAVALIWGTERITYAELNSAANRLAWQLRSLGVGPEAVVGVWLSRGFDMVAALLAILKAGGAFVGLNHRDPPERIRFVVEDLDVRIILTSESLEASLPATSASVVTVGAMLAQGDRIGNPSRVAAGTDRNLSYVIYTSGSTGQPKAVGIEHASAVAFLSWAGRAFEPEELAGVLATTSPAFDCILFELFTPLCWGGTAVLADSVLDLADLPACAVTLVGTVPAAMRELVARGLPTSVRTVSLSGDVLPGALVAELHQSTGVSRVCNFYGVSEGTTYVTGAVCRSGPERADGRDPAVGRPIDNVQVYVLDSWLAPVPIGVAGELCVGGSGIARGYLGRPGTTAMRFVPNPFADEPGARLYRTGDRARWLPDGSIEFLGRLDRQVKIRGYRVEPGEVEHALLAHDAVREAAVVVRPARQGDQRLIAYVVPNGSSALTAADLREHVRRRVPDYMVPTVIVPLQSMPHTATGKVDTALLPDLDPTVSAERADEAPWRLAETTELQVTDVMCELLGIADMEHADNFFDLGGHSLLAVALLSRAERLFGVRVPLASFLAAPTPEGLASSLRQQAWRPSRSSLVRICGGGTSRPFFCVHPGGAEVYRMSNLRRALGDRPVYGLLSVGFNGEAEPLVSIEAMASHYLTEISHLQPEGPYLLGGYSVGGMVAYEMAQQLLRRGAQVGYLALFEPMLPILRPPDGEGTQDHQPSLSVDEILTLDGLSSRGSELPSIRALRQRLGPRRANSLEVLEALLTTMKPLLAGALDELKAAGHIIPDMDIVDFYRLREIWAKYLWAALSYRGVPFPGTLTVFVSQDSVPETLPEDTVSPLAAKLRVRTFTESHAFLFTDPELARLLAVDLEAAEQPSSAARPRPASVGGER